jgi:hypothetical protein
MRTQKALDGIVFCKALSDDERVERGGLFVKQR